MNTNSEALRQYIMQYVNNVIGKHCIIHRLRYDSKKPPLGGIANGVSILSYSLKFKNGHFCGVVNLAVDKICISTVLNCIVG